VIDFASKSWKGWVGGLYAFGQLIGTEIELIARIGY
jgi:hypothetical protein